MLQFSVWADRMNIRINTASALVVLLVACSGCVTTPPPAQDFPTAQEPALVLEPGDVLQVKFLYWPELNEEGQAIRPDGKIALQLVGEVQAEGLEPDKFRQQLLGLYKDKLIDPDISVVVRSLDSQRVYVGGEVYTPGLIPIHGRLTALEAIMQAGGPRKESAKLSTVVIIRQEGGKQFATTVDLQHALESPQTDTFELAPRDIVYVPRTAIDRVDQWVDKYINKIMPQSLNYNFTFTKDLDPNHGTSNSARAAQLMSNVNSTSTAALGALSSVKP